MTYTKKIAKPLLLVLATSILISCEEFVETEIPETDIFSETVFQSNATATSAVLHIYSQMNSSSNFSGGGSSSLSLLQGLSADELASFTSGEEFGAFFFNNVQPENTQITNLWSTCYNMIYNSNSIIEGLKNPSSQVSQEVKTQLLGEAKFIRAFCHFYLVNLFGEIPYIATTDYRVNSTISRMSISEVYQNIIDDLVESKSLLTQEYPSDERVRPNKGAVTALLARVYLYNRDWDRAIEESTQLIDNMSMYVLNDIDSVFLRDSDETIWQLFPEEDKNNGNDGSTFIVVEAPRFSVLSEDLFNAFEIDDARKAKWVGIANSDSETYLFPFKYKSLDTDPASEYSIVFRLAEQYLIRAEAQTMKNNLAEAILDLDIIRKRAGLPLINMINPSISQSDLLLTVEKERRLELFTEWGHRWFDLARTERADDVLGNVKTGWEPTDILMPIPENEIQLNQNLSQNPGY